MRNAVLISWLFLFGNVLLAQDAEAIIKEYELELWKIGLGDVFAEQDFDLEFAKSIEAILSALDDCEAEKCARMYRTLKTMKRVNLFTQVEAVRGPGVSLEGLRIVFEQVKGTSSHRLRTVFRNALNDVRLSCLWGRKYCIQKVKEAIKKGAQLDRVNEIRDFSALNEEDAEVLRKLQAIAKAKSNYTGKRNLKNWQRLYKEVKDYQGEFKEKEFTLMSIDVEFPYQCTACLEAYANYITEVSAKEAICLNQIKYSKKHKAFWSKLEKAKNSFHEYKADEENGKHQFKKDLASFADLTGKSNQEYFDFDKYAMSSKPALSRFWERYDAIPPAFHLLLEISLILTLFILGYKLNVTLKK